MLVAPHCRVDVQYWLTGIVYWWFIDLYIMIMWWYFYRSMYVCSLLATVFEATISIIIFVLCFVTAVFVTDRHVLHDILAQDDTCWSISELISFIARSSLISRILTTDSWTVVSRLPSSRFAYLFIISLNLYYLFWSTRCFTECNNVQMSSVNGHWMNMYLTFIWSLWLP